MVLLRFVCTFAGDMRQKRILVVDDEQDLCEILLYNLKAAGYQVEAAYTGDPCQKPVAHDGGEPDSLRGPGARSQQKDDDGGWRERGSHEDGVRAAWAAVKASRTGLFPSADLRCHLAGGRGGQRQNGGCKHRPHAKEDGALWQLHRQPTRIRLLF